MREARQIFTTALLGGLLYSNPAYCQETAAYTYDALGRLIGVSHSGGPNDGVVATYHYDSAGNRTQVVVNGITGGSGGGGNADPGAGASSPRQVFAVVPLNGYTVITATVND